MKPWQQEIFSLLPPCEIFKEERIFQQDDWKLLTKVRYCRILICASAPDVDEVMESTIQLILDQRESNPRIYTMARQELIKIVENFT